MDDAIATFLAFTGSEDSATAKQYLELTGNNVEYAVQLFMESGNATHPPDEEVAQQMQQQAYQEQQLPDVRDADANVHRHETLLDSFGSYGPVETDMFGLGRVGVFNQRFEELDNDDSVEDLDFENDSDEVVEVQSRTARLHGSRMAELTSTQRRLAQLFKPPFDLIERTNLDGAKIKGRAEEKWILINIQDPSEFQSQVINRDFWSNAEIKRIVKANFVFLQFQLDLPNGQSYSNFYHLDACPHLAILDPMTGERVYQWTDGSVPDVEDWASDVELFLGKFSLHPHLSNPAVKHEPRFDPDAMTEEQQIEFALRQSIGASAEAAICVDDLDTEQPTDAVVEPLDPFDSITAEDHIEPATGTVTRIQIRFPNGKRLIHKFDFESDKVRTLYQWLKHVLQTGDAAAYGIEGGDRFTASSVGKPHLLDLLDDTIGEAGLKNASILIEKE